jgi:trimeric autotransporter adhesin
MNPLIQFKTTPLLLIILALCWFALSPPLKAQCPSACGAGGNTGVGINALDSVTTGINNAALGTGALTDDTTGSYNVAVGNGALQSNTTGFQNMAIGAEALTNNIVGNFNMGIGFRALFMNTGSRNSAVGAAALRNNTTASDNTAIGSVALRENTTGENNTAIGAAALAQNTIAEENTAIGADALRNNTIGEQNTAIGAGTLLVNNAHLNTATGAGALLSNVTGHGNTANGAFALSNNTSGDDNIALGNNAGSFLTTGNFNIDIGNVGLAGESRTIRIGNNLQTRTFIAGIRGVTTGVANAIPVLIDGLGQLGTMSSSRRFKEEIKPMDQNSEAIHSLRPVTFHYKSDASGTPQFGLIAEEVADVNPDLVVRDENGEIYTVRYEALNAMLLNEFLKEHLKNEEQQKQINVLTAQLKEQAGQIQKVSAQLAAASPSGGGLEASKPAPQMVNNP